MGIYYTPETYLDYCFKEMGRKAKSGHYVSPIKLLFKPDDFDDENFIDNYDDWLFTPDNWNGGDIVRRFLCKYAPLKTDLYDIRYYCIDDQTYIFLLNGWEFIEISWYKDRGCTEKIYKNGYPISLKDYIDLYNHLYNYLIEITEVSE